MYRRSCKRSKSVGKSASLTLLMVSSFKMQPQILDSNHTFDPDELFQGCLMERPSRRESTKEILEVQ